MARKIVFATNNKHKLEELRQIAGDEFEILSLADIGCSEELPETADTLEGNAEMKARWIKDHYGYDCFADDTGLEVEALGGAPGVYSARYASAEGHDSIANMQLLLKNLENCDNRKARFRTVIAFIESNDLKTFEGIVDGCITREPAGDSGFGYDPVFMPNGWNITFAQVTAEAKNEISHRGRATRRFLLYLTSQKE